MIPAKKSLGQNFLKSKEALRAIIFASDISPTDTILEVGPGKGALTTEILKSAGKVVAIEKDHRLIGELSEKFKKEIENEKLELIEGDVLDHPALQAPLLGKGGEYKIIANIPYYITGSFLQKFLESENQPSKMVLMLQKEVAERIVAGTRTENKESILSLSVKIFGTPKYIMTVKSKYFSPEPNVDSAIISIEDISKKRLGGLSEEKFFQVVKAGFAHKRKMLLGNLKGIFPEVNWLAIFKTAEISEKARAEDIVLEQWKILAENLN